MKNDDATLVIGSANFFKAPAGTEFPLDLKNPGAEFENVGHTSLEDIFGQSSEGGEATVLGTLQKKALRTSRSPRSDLWTFILQQFDVDSLKLYYGSNAVTLPNGNLAPDSSNPAPTVCAFLVVFYDGDNAFAFYAQKAEVYRSDDPSFSDTESLSGLPLGVTPVAYGTNKHAFEITPLASVTP